MSRPSSLASLASTAAIAALSILFLPACSGWLSVDRVASAQKKPNNVWVFLSVQRSREEPITGLTASDFTIYEDGNLLKEGSSKQILQAPEVASVAYTLLLVDLSGAGASGPPDALVDAARAFAERVGKTQKVGVYGFDGDPKIHPLVPFAEAQAAAPAGKGRAPADPFDAMRRFKAKDPSTNLYGATVEALHELRRAMDREQRPIKFGTLVVYAEGIDRAARVSRWDMRNEMDDDKYKLYEVFGAGSGADRSFVEDVGRDGIDVPLDRAGVKDALDRIAGKIEVHARRFYLLSFCTAARKGDHEVKITARVKQPPEGSGSLSYTFKADGLGPPPDCDPKAPPVFDMKPPEEKKEDAKPSGKGAPQGGPKPVLIGPPPPGGAPP